MSLNLGSKPLTLRKFKNSVFLLNLTVRPNKHKYISRSQSEGSILDICPIRNWTSTF